VKRRRGPEPAPQAFSLEAASSLIGGLVELILLSKFHSLCDKFVMDRFRLIGRLLAVFVIVGLVAAPAVVPTGAKLLSTFAANNASTMPADMPCCPDTQKSGDCQDCPLRATCTLGVAQIEPPSTTVIAARLLAYRSFPVFDDLVADGIDGPPPDQPPRNLV
jgi:hypothetical protein